METSKRLTLEQIPEWARAYHIKQLKKEEKQAKQITLQVLDSKYSRTRGKVKQPKEEKSVQYMSFEEKCDYYGYDKKNIISSIVLNKPNTGGLASKLKNARIRTPFEIRFSKNHRAAA